MIYFWYGEIGLGLNTIFSNYTDLISSDLWRGTEPRYILFTVIKYYVLESQQIQKIYHMVIIFLLVSVNFNGMTV